MSKKSARPALRRLLVLFLTAALLLPVANAALLPPSEMPDTTTPSVRVVSTLVDGGKYLEVGLNIDSKEGGKFQSAGVLLKYDPGMLTPVQWDEAATEIEVPESSEAARAWSEAVILPAKGADELNGKIAAAAKSGGSGFLYLSAESARARETFIQPLPTETGNTERLPVLPDKTTQGFPVSAVAKAEAPTRQAVVARFKVNEKPPVQNGGETSEGEAQPQLYSLEELAAALDIVDPAADETVTLSFPLADKSGLTYIADNAAPDTAGLDSQASLKFVWVQEGVTVNSGTGGNAEDFASIVFYDWDETTILGSIVVPKGDATEQVKEFTKSLMSPESRDYSIMSDAEDTAKPYFVDDTNYPMTYKKGYSFLTWMPMDSDEPTSYGERVASDSGGTMATESGVGAKKKLIKPTDTIDFTNIVDSLILKAAYTTNEDCVVGPGQANRYYEINPIEFSRYGTTNNFTIKFEIKRNNVPRMSDPILRIKMRNGSTTLLSTYQLSGSDVEYMEIVPFTTNTGGIDRITYSVVDGYGLSNMNAASARTAEGTTYLERGNVKAYSFDGSATRNVVEDGAKAFMHKSILGGLNTALEEYDPSQPISTMTGVTAGVLWSIGISTNSQNANALRTALYDKWKTINMTGEIRNEVIRGLTRLEMIEALGTQATSPILP